MRSLCLKLIALAKIAWFSPTLLFLVIQITRTKRTYLNTIKLWSLIDNIRRLSLRRAGAPLAVAEFGVGRGGSALMLAWLVNRYGGKLTLYDLFGQIPPPGEKDGLQAQGRYRHIREDENSRYYGNIPDLLEVIQKELVQVCDLNQVEFVQGKYEEILWRQQPPRVFDFVHIDCDWYESSKAVYAYLEHNLRHGALLQVDDYGFWEGSKLAVDEALWLQGRRRWAVANALVIDTGR